MPNYCDNILTVSGPVKDVDRFIEMAKGRDSVAELTLSLDSLYPIPDDKRAEGWYDWCVEHWGTKWDLWDVDVDVTTHVNGEDKSVVYCFISAWSPPDRAFSHLLNGEEPGYENLHFHLAFSESGMGFIGVGEGSVEDGFSVWDDECHDSKDFAYRSEAIGFVGQIESYEEWLAWEAEQTKEQV